MNNLKLSENDIVKLAAASPKARKMILKLAATDPSTDFNETVPSINQDRAAYNESNGSGTGTNNGTFKKVVPSASVNSMGQADEAAAIPMEEQGGEMMEEGPEAIGARAAQSFLGPEIMSAAMSGDPAAIDLIARTAGQVASAMTDMAIRNSSNGEMPQEGFMPQEGQDQMNGMEGQMASGNGAAPAPITTPEQDLASEIVPPVAANPPQMQNEEGAQNTNGNGESNSEPADKNGFPPKKNGNGFPPKKNGNGDSKGNGGDDDKIDLQTVAKLIQAAKSGKI